MVHTSNISPQLYFTSFAILQMCSVVPNKEVKIIKKTKKAVIIEKVAKLSVWGRGGA